MECCADYVVSSYTPTLTSRLRTQTTAPASLARHDISLALVAESKSKGCYPILGVDEEARVVTDIAKTHNIHLIHRKGATNAQISTAMKDATIAHFACHGVQDSTDPLQSAFCLSNEQLTLTHLIDMKLSRPFLAFLSACNTAEGDMSQPDQAIHLAAGMLFCGFRSVVATLW
jgi:CHAT domain-containing protein